MLLLVTGPVIGQLSAFGESRHHHHASVSMSSMASPSAEHHSLSGVLGWHEQCDYCSLFQHFPVLTGVLSFLARIPPLGVGEPVARTRSAYGDLAVFPHALTRAPPASVR